MAQLYYRYSTMNAGKSIELIKVAYNYEERGKQDLTLIPVKHMDEVLPLALEGWKEFEAKLHKHAGHKKSVSGKTRKTAKRAVKKASAVKVPRPAKKAAKTAKKAVPARKGAAKAKAKGKGGKRK